MTDGLKNLDSGWEADESPSGASITGSRESDVRAIVVPSTEFLEEEDLFSRPLKEAIDGLGSQATDSMKLTILMSVRDWIEQKRQALPQEFLLKNISLMVNKHYQEQLRLNVKSISLRAAGIVDKTKLRGQVIETRDRSCFFKVYSFRFYFF